MAVVTKYSQGYPDPTNYRTSKGEWSQYKSNGLYFEVAVANGDSSTSVFYLGRIPSSALILPISTLYTTAITGLTSFSVGLTNELGTTVANALLNAQTMASATSFSLVGNVGTTNYGKQAWQLLGLTTNPGGLLSVIGTMNAAATAAGTINGHLYWSYGF
jgi:hypothetical protein